MERSLAVIQTFQAAHRLTDVTVVADAGMISLANQLAFEQAGLSFILGFKVPDVPYLIAQWRDNHPGQGVGRSANLHPTLAGHPRRQGEREAGPGDPLPVPR